MANYKTVPNQRIITIDNKMPCNDKSKDNYYARINLNAMDAAAQKLDAGAFKLWIYFAKNQEGYEFALSSKAVEETFGMKIKQYTNAFNQLVELGYLVNTNGNNYAFRENPVITKSNNEKEEEKPVMPKGNNVVIPKSNNGVTPKGNNALFPKEIRNITTTTKNTTINITESEKKEEEAKNINIILPEEMSFFLHEKDCFIQGGLSEEEAAAQAMNIVIAEREGA